MQIPFTWSDSFDDRRKMEIRSMKFEKASMLYNYAVFSYYIGNSQQAKATPSDRKDSIKTFRGGAWAIDEIRSLSVSL